MLLEHKLKSISLSQNEQDIADFIINNKEKIKTMSTRDIAKETFTSPSSVIRLAKKLNYSGFDELKEKYLLELDYINTHFNDIDPNIPISFDTPISQSIHIMASLQKETADDTAMLLTHTSLENIIQLIHNAQTIYIIALENNYYIAENFKYKLNRINKKVILEQQYGNSYYNGFHANKDDCVIAISYSGETKRVCNAVEVFKERDVPIISITSIADSYLRSLSSYTLDISTREKLNDKIASFTSEYSIMQILNTVYLGVFQKDYHQNLIYKMKRNKSIENRFSLEPILKDE